MFSCKESEPFLRTSFLVVVVWVSWFKLVFVVQMKFTDAMRSKARLSITGSTGENGRVPVAYLRPGLPMSLSMTDLSWPDPCQCLTAAPHILLPSDSEWKCLSSPLVTNDHSPWEICPDFQSGVSQSYHAEDSWSYYLLFRLQRLDTSCPPTTGCRVLAKTCQPTKWITEPSAKRWLVIYNS